MSEPEKSFLYFSFSIPNLLGSQRGGLGDLVSRMMAANIEILDISGFAVRQRMKVVCVPKDANKFRTFLKAQKLRASEKTAVKLIGDNKFVMTLLHRWALSGDLFPAFSISTKAGGLVHLPDLR